MQHMELFHLQLDLDLLLVLNLIGAQSRAGMREKKKEKR